MPALKKRACTAKCPPKRQRVGDPESSNNYSDAPHGQRGELTYMEGTHQAFETGMYA